MKVKKNEMGMKELFRKKLENAELIPGEAVKTQLLKKLARQEFVRFYPSRLNIYYVGLMAAAVLTAGIMVLSGSKQKSLESHVPAVEVKSPINAVEIEKGMPVLSKAGNEVSVKNSNLTEASAGKTERIETQNTIDTSSGRVVEPGTSTGYTIPGNKLPNASLIRDSGKFLEKSAEAKPLFKASQYSGCKPLRVKFISSVDPSFSLSWNFGDGGYSSAREPEWLFDVEGEYRVSLTVKVPGGKELSQSAIINVFSRPDARFEISPDNPVIPDDEIKFMNYSTNGLTYTWNFGDGSSSGLFEPRHRYQKFGNYNISLVVTSESGCADTMTVVNAFSGNGYFIEMPNAFVPNSQGPSGGFYSAKSDEAAEIFHPHFSGVSDYQLKIFSRTGILLFESNDVNTGWDGYFKGQLCNTGVYIWKVRGTFNNGEPFTKMGDLTLLKN